MHFSVLFILSIFIFSSGAVPVLAGSEMPVGFKYHTVRRGDFLGKIAPPEQWDLIKRVNRIDESHLIIGKKILIPDDLEKAAQFHPVPGHLKDAEQFKKVAYVFLEIQYFGVYENGNLIFWGPISSGKKGRETPKGTFKALWKARYYYSKKYDADMPFAVNISADGYFLHAQSLPGRPASHGCIRLLRSDAKKIFDWIDKNDPVILTSKSIARPAMLFSQTKSPAAIARESNKKGRSAEYGLPLSFVSSGNFPGPG